MRKYQPSKSPRKQFINSYHLNEVPLPYYNPLEDPHLRPFFNNYLTHKLITERGLIYQARKEYPYQERRQTNYNKFLRSNSYKIPQKHQIHNLEDYKRKPNFLKEDALTHYQSTRTHFNNKMSESDCLLKQTPKFDFGLKRPLSTTHGSQCSQQRERGITFKSQFSSKKQEGMSESAVML